jgi:hypothetical protein
VLSALQRWLVKEKVSEYFNRERVRFDFVPEQIARDTIGDILAAAATVGKAGQVAQYLVGAKLALRFPEVNVRNDSYSTADASSGQPGDFLVGDTAFHVTVSPTPAHYDKCKANVAAGYEVLLLVPRDIATAVDLYVQKILPGRASTDAIETFVARNLEDIGGFKRAQRNDGLRRLLETYNARVDAVETDKSLLIELPHNLLAEPS